jgi:hypothetical protein
MKSAFLGRSHPPRPIAGFCAAALALLPACAGQKPLQAALIAYDQSLSSAQNQMLLLNIARAHRGRPLHFSTVAGIAATFDRRVEASFGAELGAGSANDLYLPGLGGSLSENPTLNVVPIQGQEFVRRLLAPLDEHNLAFFHHQGVDTALLLRLLVQAIIVETPEGRRFVKNSGTSAESGNSEFEAFVQRLAALSAESRLDIGPVPLEESWPLPAAEPTSANDLADLIERGFRLDSGGKCLWRPRVGRTVLTNQDSSQLTLERRRQLQANAERYPSYCVRFELDADPNGPEQRGWIKLRSLAGILQVVGQEVERSTGSCLTILQNTAASPSELVSVHYLGQRYALQDDPAGQGRLALALLSALYQLTVSEVPGEPLPAITIAK